MLCIMGTHGFLGLVVSLLFVLMFFSPSLASKRCDFPAIFNFGDSNSDTGGLAASAFYIPTPPYGDTFFHAPAGRFSDGRLMIDFIAESFGLRYLDAYLDAVGSNFTNGANFATSSSTIIPLRNVFPLGGFSPFSLNIQYRQFMQLKNGSQYHNIEGGIFSKLLPREDYFSKALFTFDVGQNDLAEKFFANMSMQEVKAFVPDMINNFSAIIKNVYNQGGRSFWIHNTGPIGCLPYVFINLPVMASQIDKAGCATPYNEVAKYFNQMLKESMVDLRNELPSAAITYVDIYSAKYTIISQAQKYGFEHPLVTCCGYGGEYNYNNVVGCGGTINVNGTQFFVVSCNNPSIRVIWDGIHFTEAANKWIYDQISDGAFSDPHVSLRMSCNK